MNSALYDKLSMYKQLTLNMIEAANDEKYEAIEMLLSDRENLISVINQLQYTKEEFKRMVSELNILETQKHLDDIMEEKRNCIKANISTLQVNRNANKSYNKQHYANVSLLNEQI